MGFRTEHGVDVPAVTAEQMREVDRIAVERFGLTILQMMENAGRSLAETALEMLGAARGGATVLAGSGGNGGGGLCCARHLANRGVDVRIVLDRAQDALKGAAEHQLRILLAAGLEPVSEEHAGEQVEHADLVIDALIGYGLAGPPRGRTAELIEAANVAARRVLSLDLPSGLDATTGEALGPAVQAERTLALALPKTGLVAAQGELHLADIGIPGPVFAQLGLAYEEPFGAHYRVQLFDDTRAE